MDLVSEVAEVLNKACFQRFDAKWSDVDARCFAIIAIETVKNHPEYKRKSQMTREEAFKLAKTLGNSVPWNEDVVRLLEALGLIKFDQDVAFDKNWYGCGITRENVRALEKKGYMIVKFSLGEETKQEG